jgi:hypothetical protein
MEQSHFCYLTDLGATFDSLAGWKYFDQGKPSIQLHCGFITFLNTLFYLLSMFQPQQVDFQDLNHLQG